MPSKFIVSLGIFRHFVPHFVPIYFTENRKNKNRLIVLVDVEYLFEITHLDLFHY